MCKDCNKTFTATIIPSYLALIKVLMFGKNISKRSREADETFLPLSFKGNRKNFNLPRLTKH